MTTNQQQINDFLELSIVLTAFSAYKLNGTGQLEEYFNTVIEIVGTTVMEALLNAFTEAKQDAGGDDLQLEKQLRYKILSNDKLGPVTRNIIKMWFIGSWYQLPPSWRASYGASDKDVTFVVSTNSYIEGLLWPTIDSQPPGAKSPGYATWTEKPQISKL